jgi:hypothetical protein
MQLHKKDNQPDFKKGFIVNISKKLSFGLTSLCDMVILLK